MLELVKKRTKAVLFGDISPLGHCCARLIYFPEFSIYYMWEKSDTFDRIPPQGTEGKYISQIDGTLYLANVQVGQYEA